MIFLIAIIYVIINLFLYKVIYNLKVSNILRLYYILINFVFLGGYLIKVFTFYFVFQAVGLFSILNPDFRNFSFRDFQLASYDVIIFYSIFILQVTIVYTLSSEFKKTEPKINFSSSPFQDKLFFLIVLIGFFLKGIQLFLGIGKMGAENISLPYMLDSLIFRFQSFGVFPAYAYFFAKYKLKNLRLNISFLFYTSFSVVFGSRSGLFFFLLMLVFLLILLKIEFKFKFKYFFYIILFLPLAFYFYYTGSILRGINMNNQDGLDYIVLFNMIKSSEAWSIFFESVTNRFIGLDGLMYTHNLTAKYNFFSSTRYINFFTNEVVGIKQDFDFRSPGFLASIKYLDPFNFSGSYFYCFGFFLFSTSLIVNYYLSRFSIIFQFLFMYMVYGQLSEGYVYFEDLFTLLLVYFLFVFLFHKSFFYKIY